MYSTCRLRRGFSLIELMLVLSVIGVLLVGILNFQKHQRFETDISLIKYNAEQLGQALNQYYNKHCHDSGFPPSHGQYDYPVYMQDLIYDRLLPPGSFVDIPWVKFSMTIRSDISWQNDYNLWVFATINKSDEEVNYIRGKLNAIFDEIGDKQNKKKIGWMLLPSERPASMESANWIMNAGAAEFNNVFKSDKFKPCAS